MKKNIGNTDRTVIVVLSVIIAAIGYYYKSWWGLVAFVPLATSYIGFCPLYKVLGISSCSKKEC